MPPLFFFRPRAVDALHDVARTLNASASAWRGELDLTKDFVVYATDVTGDGGRGAKESARQGAAIRLTHLPRNNPSRGGARRGDTGVFEYRRRELRQTEMKLRTPIVALFVLVGACAGRETRAPDVAIVPVPPAVVSAPQQPPPVTMSAQHQPPSAAMSASPSVPACGPQPDYAPPTVQPTCSDFTLRDGHAFHDQLTVQLSSGATTRIDCPRMRFRGQDTPVCVTRTLAGRVRAACCPPGHADPTDPECVAEGSVDEMFKRQKVWDWCSNTEAPRRPCEPCVWVSGAAR